MIAYLTVPVLELSCEMVDFGTCLVNQTRSEAILVMNKSGSRCYWTALLGEKYGAGQSCCTIQRVPHLGAGHIRCRGRKAF